jgi:hypothetical protein
MLASERRLLEDEQLVCMVFERKSALCIHELHAYTDISYPSLQLLLGRLIRRGYVTLVGDPEAGKDDKQYMRIGAFGLSEKQFMTGRLSPLIGLTEDVMQNRVHMIKRMKDRLISEWHPVLNVLLGDYERDLQRVRIVREPFCEADEVVQKTTGVNDD